MKKIILTNWINLMGFILLLFVFNFYFYLGEKNIFYKSLFITFYVFIVFGSFIWIGVLLSLIAIDTIFILKKIYKNYLNLGIIMQSILICLPYICWSIMNKNVNSFSLSVIITFTITQYIRKGMIKKILNSGILDEN